MSWKEYRMENRTAADWLPWGGITEPTVMECKDGSLIGVLAYEPLPKGAKVSLPELANGWSFWSERQAGAEGEKRDYLAACWNPFPAGEGKVEHPLGGRKPIAPGKAREAFSAAWEAAGAAIGKASVCRALAYQELLDYFSFALSMGTRAVPMPEVPLYLDALLTDGLGLRLEGNGIRLGEGEVIVLSLPAGAEDGQREVIEKALSGISFRSVRRLLRFTPEAAEQALGAYMAAWCKGRRSVRRLLSEGILGSLSGYYADSLILLVPEGRARETERYVRDVLELLELPCIAEDYNRKDVWWGSLPGLFRAGVVPPLLGFSGLEELLWHRAQGTEGEM